MRITTEFVQASPEEAFELSYSLVSKGRRVFWWVFSAAGAVVSLLTLANSRVDLLPLGFGLIGMGVGDWLYVRWWINSRLAHPENKHLRQPARAIITEDDLTIEAQDGTTSCLPWSRIVRVEAYRGDYLLYIGHKSAIRMFRRVQSPEDWQAFTRFVEGLRKPSII